MPSDINRPNELLTASLLAEVNSSGFPFQHAVVQSILAVDDGWSVEATEFPISYPGGSTHIDLLAWWGQHVLLVGECKRANPAFANWLFLRSPFTFGERGHAGMWFERLFPTNAERVAPFVQVIDALPHVRPWHIALEVKTGEKGDPKGQGRTLSTAVTQVQLGVNGMLSRLLQEGNILRQRGSIIFRNWLPRQLTETAVG